MDRRAYLSATLAILGGCASSRTDAPRSDAEVRRPAGSDTTDTRTAADRSDDVTPASGVVEPGSEDDFADLSRWDVSGGIVVGDEDRALLGAQSARLEADAGSQTTVLSKSFGEPVDVSEVVPGVAMAAEAVTVPWLDLIDEHGNRLRYRRGVAGHLPLMRYNFGIDAVDDAFDQTAVTDVELRLWTPAGERRTIWFDDLHFVPRPETGKVMIQFDDTYRTDYTEALPILEEYGYEAVTFVNPDYVGRKVHGSERLSEKELDALHEAGWCIANHAETHPRLSELDPDEQEREIRVGKEWLEERGYEDGARYFAYPFGDFDATTIDLVDEYHEIGFAGGRPVQGYTSNTVLASRFSEPDRKRAELEFERTAAFPGITCFFFHELTDEYCPDFADAIEVLHEYESAGEIDVVLPRDLEEELLF